tara:strand:+ start:21176 stop:23179 length:2004 start_codon:yes stop_codon:yes gene_type:complete
MSNVNIKRAVENIRSGTTVYTPLVEVIVNAIQAIEAKSTLAGKIEVAVIRSNQSELDGKIPSVASFLVEDNGVGFDDENRDSFDTLYSDYKIEQGGKGFGRFTCLKYFSDLKVRSIYQSDDGIKLRSFSMGKGKDIIVSEKVEDSDQAETGSKVSLLNVKNNKFSDKKLSTIARVLVERLLPYFIEDDYHCPLIVLKDSISDEKIVLNEFVSNQLSAQIMEIPLKERMFSLSGAHNDNSFTVRLFKFYSPKSQRSRVSLVAHRREVTNSPIHTYIPEFIEEFYDKAADGGENRDRNYIVKAYVFGDYLDGNVSLERGGFDFQRENDLILGVSQTDIEKQACDIAKEAIGGDITARQERKKERVHSYVEENAPWHRETLEDIDLSSMPYDPSPEEIETRLQKEKYKQEQAIKRDVTNLLENSDIDSLKENVPNIVRQISKTSKNDLIHYIALRKNVLDIFARSLELDEGGKYSSEGTVHDIIFPRKGDTEKTSFKDHNLWIIDERLNFTNYVSSDNPLDNGNSERPDLLAYDKRVMFRGDNEASNPVTIFEFKKPQRDDFVNPSSKEDPVQQIIRYVNHVREGKFKTPEGRKILIADNTPFYGYVVCDLSSKVEKWLDTEKDFKPMPDGLGWFQWRENINLYMEVLSWDKVLKDSEMRNKIFFHKLGI